MNKHLCKLPGVGNFTQATKCCPFASSRPKM